MQVNVELLRSLAARFEARSPAKLRAVARRQHVPATPADIRAALSTDVSRQVFAPKPRSLGRSAATAPGSNLQADLIDLSNNTGAKFGEHKYALTVSDVFTRRAWTEPLRYKDAANTNSAFRKILKEVPGHGDNAVVTTDQGNEFKGLENQVLPKSGVHIEKEVTDRNAIAVVDRTIQTLKKDLASRLARTGQPWAKEIHAVTEAYNERPNEAVHGAPATAGEESAQGFFVLQDNARAFLHNRNLSMKRQAALREAGAFRAPNIGETRSFRPAYKDTVQTLGKITPGAGYVTNTTGKKTLLKHALPVPQGSGKPLAHLTTPRRQPGPRLDHQPSVAVPPPPLAPAPQAPPAAKKKGADFFKALGNAYGSGAGPK